MNNITFDELYEILYALEDKAEYLENNKSEIMNETEKDEKIKYLKSISKKIEYKLNNWEA